MASTPGSDTSERGVFERVGEFFEKRTVVFLYNLIILIALALLMLSFLREGWVFDKLPERLQETQRVLFYAVWFGALGGIVISMKGVYDHCEDWDDCFTLWHYGRPFTGAAVGGMTYVLLKAVNPNQEPTTAVVAVAAFALGTQENRFFTFLYEVANLVLTVPPKDHPLSVFSLDPKAGPGGESIKLMGQGFKPGMTAKIGDYSLSNVTIAQDGRSASGTLPADARASAGKKLSLAVENTDGFGFTMKEAFEVQEPPQSNQPPGGSTPTTPTRNPRRRTPAGGFPLNQGQGGQADAPPEEQASESG